MTDKISIDEQIKVVEAEALEDAGEQSEEMSRAILETLRDYKRIMEAKVPEPVATVTFSSHLSGVTVWALPGASSALSTGDKLYGPEVLDLLRRETAKNERIKELLREALSVFEITQRIEDYPADHWASKSAALLAEVEKEK